MSVDSSSWKIKNEQKLTCKVLGMSSLPQFETNKLFSLFKVWAGEQASDHVDHTRFHIVEMGCQMVQLLSAHIVGPTMCVNLTPAL